MTLDTHPPAAGRDPAVQAFLTSVGDALASRALATDEAAAVGRIFGALAMPGLPGDGGRRRLPVCAVLPEAYAEARRHAAAVPVVDALGSVEPRLCWALRGAGGPHASANRPDGHANATVVGPGGLEARDDLLVGLSLLAPHVRYPDHSHSPEEVYLVLSPGRFQHGTSGWFEPGIGGTLYNEPNVRHAMASDGAPLLAVWLLWTGEAPPGA